MSWDGVYAEDRHYPQFEIGDEIFTTKKSWKSITDNKPYQVVKCCEYHLVDDLAFDSTVETCHKDDVENVIKLIYHTLLNIEENYNFKHNS